MNAEKIQALAIAIFAGVLNPFLSGMNATLSQKVHQPIWSVAAVFAIALSAVVAVALATGEQFPNFASIVQAPWWSWFGGLFAAGYVLSMTLVASKLGSSVFTGVTVTIAIIVSIVLDHFGFVGFEVHKVSVLRVVGGIFMMGGLALIVKS